MLHYQGQDKGTKKKREENLLFQTKIRGYLELVKQLNGAFLVPIIWPLTTNSKSYLLPNLS